MIEDHRLAAARGQPGERALDRHRARQRGGIGERGAGIGIGPRPHPACGRAQGDVVEDDHRLEPHARVAHDDRPRDVELAEHRPQRVDHRRVKVCASTVVSAEPASSDIDTTVCSRAVMSIASISRTI